MIADFFINLMLLPVRLIVAPIDLFLAQFPDLNIVSQAIDSIAPIVGSIPSTLLYVTGINPIIWNAMFGVFIAYLVAAPVINGIKLMITWIRG